MYSREALVSLLASASVRGHLGLFIGSGFSMAATAGSAPSFHALLEQLSSALNLSGSISGDQYRHLSYPQVASKFIEELVAKGMDRGRAEAKLRREVARLTNFLPDETLKDALQEGLNEVGPAWIITTNYDLVIESLMDDAQSILSSQPLFPNTEQVPVYHLHGHRRFPSTIRITEEDYVGLVGPLDYQRLKLPLLFAESTTLMIGYALGDINIRGAMDWSRAFGDAGRHLASIPGQGLVVQALYVSGRPATPTPFIGRTKEQIVEISDLVSFLREIADARRELNRELEDVKTDAARFLADPANPPLVATNPVVRGNFLRIVEDAMPLMSSYDLVSFLGNALDPVWESAREDQGFEHYDTYLCIVVDVLHRLDHRSTNPVLLGYLADALDMVGYYVPSDGKLRHGKAYKATKTWIARHQEIDEALKEELIDHAATYTKPGLSNLLDLAAISGTS